ncbi:MAG TPA: methyltransferase domain-containing protein [Pseudorhodoferax sp.]|nr:methyltransferase domain-containing protein [Pseudorhodoferax sp.]
MACGDRQWRSADAGHDRTDWQHDAWFEDSPREPTELHRLRLQAAHDALRASGARTVADLGCGDGALVRRLLADATITRIVGLDRDLSALGRLERSVDPAALATGRLHLLHGSFATPPPGLDPTDAAVLLETIEHVPLTKLSAVEQHVFGTLAPATVIVTTPNQEFNVLFGMAPGQMREPSHCFEWPRQRFRNWAAGIALRRGYAVKISGIGAADLNCGSPTQMALFTRYASHNGPPCRSLNPV